MRFRSRAVRGQAGSFSLLGFSRMGLSGVMLIVLSLASCGYFETGYFQSKVNEATQEMVGKRYGAPHKIEALDKGGEVWIYYDRGSATASYSGYSKGTFCRAYMLSFDKDGTLRGWEQRDCRD